MTQRTPLIVSSRRERIVTHVGHVALLAALSGILGCGTLAIEPVGAINTPALDYRQMELEIATEFNDLRANPSNYSAKLSALLPLFNGNTIRRPGWSTAITTQEGASAVQEAISVLRSQPAISVTALSSSLSLAARDLAIDQGRTSQIGHTGSDGSTPESRMARYGTWGTSYAESVDYGSFIRGRDVILDFLIDDGVPSRGHRRNMLDATARVIGVACGPHPRYGSVCVIDQAGSFVAR